VCDVKREKVIQRIVKLLAVTEEHGATQNEAISAALQAQRLIVENDVSDEELYGGSQRELKSVYSEFVRGKRWRGWLAQAIADNFRCKSYMAWRGKGHDREYARVFYGYDLDAQAALLTYEKLAVVGERLASQFARDERRLFGTAKGVKNHFLAGFVDGVRSELAKQSIALLVVTPREVEEGFKDIEKGFSQRKQKPILVSPDETGARRRGFAKGAEAVRSSRLEQGGELLLTG